jgi:hypothetical protein
MEELVEEVESTIPGSTVIACARSGWRHIFGSQVEESIDSFQNA